MAWSLCLVALVVIGWTGPLVSLARAIPGAPAQVSGERVAFVGLGLVMLAKWLLGFARLVVR